MLAPEARFLLGLDSAHNFDIEAKKYNSSYLNKTMSRRQIPNHPKSPVISFISLSIPPTTPIRDPSRIIATIDKALEIVDMDDDSSADLFQCIVNEEETTYNTYRSNFGNI